MADSDETTRERLARWYAVLPSRHVDIVGDYGGKELFLIHGDSLILHCISSSRVDFEGGFQLLHAIFAVENFLSHLKSRGCNFHVVFFDDHQELCIPAVIPERKRYKYRLARTIIIQHLQRYMNGDNNCDHLVSCFPSCGCSAFGSWLAQNAILFLLCHDGHESDQSSSTMKGLFHYMIHRFLRHEYSIALIHRVEFRSSRVFATMITSAPTFQSLSPFSAQFNAQLMSNRKQDGLPAVVDLDSLKYTGSSFREWLIVDTLSKVLQTYPRDDYTLGAIALIVHAVIIKQASLSERSLDLKFPIMTEIVMEDAGIFMKLFCEEATLMLHENTADSRLRELDWDLFDFFDGRLFLSMYSHIFEGHPLPLAILEETKRLAKHVEKQSGTLLTQHRKFPALMALPTNVLPPHIGTKQASVLPFTHEIMSEFFEAVKLDVDGSSLYCDESKIFSELSHWHNAKRTLDPKQTPKQPGFFARRRTQKFMADTLAYSASLTGATGKVIEPEIIVATQQKPTSRVPLHPDAISRSKPSSGPIKNERTNVPVHGGKKKALDEARAVQTRKVESRNSAALANWKALSREFNTEPDLAKRFQKATRLLHSLTRDDNIGVRAEVSLYTCDILYRAWASSPEPARDDRALEIAALLFKSGLETSKMPGMTMQVSGALQAVGTALKITISTISNPPTISRALCFPLLIGQDVAPAKIPTKPIDFQLQYCGPYLERRFDSKKDPRVPFEPDAWQRTVLDGIDNHKSLFIVAPTSSGKTFISFYAMKKVLQADDDGVLVYVAPTKALVNQIAAEIQARFQKSYRHEGRSVWAIHTRDYRINNPTGCQVLVTVPHVLQIMLLSPSNAVGTNAWSHRVKRIIFDEVHCIGQAEDGLIWEQLLLMAPCPIIALSATVGNPQEFYEWLKASQKSKGFELEMVQHHYRYSDLRAFFYVPSKNFDFKGLSSFNQFPVPGLDRAGSSDSKFRFIHPVAATINRTAVDLNDMSLEPRDAFSLWVCMKNNQNGTFPIDSSLDPPSRGPSGILNKSDVLEWTQKLKVTLTAWMRDTTSPFQQVRAELGRLCFPGRAGNQCEVDNPSGPNGNDGAYEVSQPVEEVKGTSVLPLLVDLRKEDGLPAILFNYDRVECERALVSVLTQLQSAEAAWKESSKDWIQHVKKYELWKVAEEKKKTARDSRKLTKDEKMREEASVEASTWESFDPDEPHRSFSFADNSKLSKSELKDTIKSLEDEHIRPYLFDALERGIGVHHAGMNRRYRQVVEMFFRKGFLTAVIATGTLALGINMPCKTVVFFGDSAYLTSLAYRQASGRAGRRGFDLLGNVVFSNNIRPRRAFELMSSRLPDLKGHFPFSTTLILRILGLMDATTRDGIGEYVGNSHYAADLFKSLLSQNRAYLGGPEAKMAIRHHLRFSIEYLRRQHLLSAEGRPLNFAGLVGHLYFTENAAFAFHSLLKGGYFHNLCSGIDKNRTETLRTLALVMAHLFDRISAAGLIANGPAPVGPDALSLVLPRLPQEAERLLIEHNAETLQIFKTYAGSFIDRTHHQNADRHLPLTGIAVGAEKPGIIAGIGIPGALPPPMLRSSFAGLSGYTDNFENIHDLCSGIRSGVFLEESAVPYLRIWPHDTDAPPLNAYLYNFFMHGDYVALTRDNRIKKGDVWFLLKDFSLVLATVVASLTNFVHPDCSNSGSGGMYDVDMINVQDVAETPDEGGYEREHRVMRTEMGTAATGFVGDGTHSASTVASKQTKKTKANVVLDSWEDDADSSSDGEYDIKRPACKTGSDSTPAPPSQSSLPSPLFSSGPQTTSLPAWQGEGDGTSLVNVLKAFTQLRNEFDEKFHKTWA
ncbi:hypothetical protein F5X99DRAFT_399678 [Biscogniauxia marginata]|nr:hypothetical protein F5X99DRAFT_399678 [Biscogniauxia marginata]